MHGRETCISFLKTSMEIDHFWLRIPTTPCPAVFIPTRLALFHVVPLIYGNTGSRVSPGTRRRSRNTSVWPRHHTAPHFEHLKGLWYMQQGCFCIFSRAEVKATCTCNPEPCLTCLQWLVHLIQTSESVQHGCDDFKDLLHARRHRSCHSLTSVREARLQGQGNRNMDTWHAHGFPTCLSAESIRKSCSGVIGWGGSHFSGSYHSYSSLLHFQNLSSKTRNATGAGHARWPFDYSFLSSLLCWC